MEISIWTEIFIAVIIAAVICSIIALLVNRCRDAKVGLGCGLMFPVSIAIFVALQFMVPDVIVVSENNGHFTHEKESIWGKYTIDGESYSLEMNGVYIANTTSEPLILYPEYYGPENMANKVNQEEPIMIPPYGMVKIKHIPNHYFTTAPSQISTKSSSVEERWVLEDLRTVAKREGFDEDF